MPPRNARFFLVPRTFDGDGKPFVMSYDDFSSLIATANTFGMLALNRNETHFDRDMIGNIVSALEVALRPAPKPEPRKKPAKLAKGSKVIDKGDRGIVPLQPRRVAPVVMLDEGLRPFIGRVLDFLRKCPRGVSVSHRL